MVVRSCKDAEIIPAILRQLQAKNSRHKPWRIDFQPAKNPDFQFNRSLTRYLKLPVTFCKPFARLHLLRPVRMHTPAKCAKTFVDLVMSLPPVPIILT
jgi:hypothetical protein